jgi:hypothetical protein
VFKETGAIQTPTIRSEIARLNKNKLVPFLASRILLFRNITVITIKLPIMEAMIIITSQLPNKPV